MTDPAQTAEPEPATIEVDQFVAAPPATVWRLLTEPDLIAQWWAPGDVSAEVGPGWRDVVLPRLAETAKTLSPA